MQENEFGVSFEGVKANSETSFPVYEPCRVNLAITDMEVRKKFDDNGQMTSIFALGKFVITSEPLVGKKISDVYMLYHAAKPDIALQGKEKVVALCQAIGLDSVPANVGTMIGGEFSANITKYFQKASQQWRNGMEKFAHKEGDIGQLPFSQQQSAVPPGQAVPPTQRPVQQQPQQYIQPPHNSQFNQAPQPAQQAQQRPVELDQHQPMDGQQTAQQPQQQPAQQAQQGQPVQQAPQPQRAAMPPGQGQVPWGQKHPSVS